VQFSLRRLFPHTVRCLDRSARNRQSRAQCRRDGLAASEPAEARAVDYSSSVTCYGSVKSHNRRSTEHSRSRLLRPAERGLDLVTWFVRLVASDIKPSATLSAAIWTCSSRASSVPHYLLRTTQNRLEAILIGQFILESRWAGFTKRGILELQCNAHARVSGLMDHRSRSHANSAVLG